MFNSENVSEIQEKEKREKYSRCHLKKRIISEIKICVAIVVVISDVVCGYTEHSLP